MHNSNNWRQASSEFVIDNYFNSLSCYGITRIADITGLDFLDIPVVSVYRPRSLTLSVSSGKGLELNDAIVSGVMESIEADVAERFSRDTFIDARLHDLPNTDHHFYSRLPLYSRSLFNPSITCSWIQLNSLTDSSTFYYPAASVTLNMGSLVDIVPMFRTGTNGLASGFSFKEAYLSGLYEVIERDSITLWRYFHTSRNVPLSIIDLSSIPFASSKSLIDRIISAGLKIVIHSISSPFGLPVFKVLIAGDIDDSLSVYVGYGCHHSAEIALNRGITEAAQARAVIISGSREDVTDVVYSKSSSNYQDFLKLFKTSYVDTFTQVVPQTSFTGTNSAIDSVHISLAQHGFQAFFKELTTAKDRPFYVVKVIIPGLEDLQSSLVHPSCRMKSFIPQTLGFRSVFLSLLDSK